MYERLVNALGGEGIATVVIAIIVIAALVILGYLLLALFRGVAGGVRLGGSRSAAPRVAVLDIVAVDQKRQLVLLRRDEIEHLVLIGGQNDLVVEAGITRMPVRTRRVEPSFAEAPPRAEPAPAATAATAATAAVAARPVEAPQPPRVDPRPVPAATPPRPSAPDVPAPLPPRRVDPASMPAPRPQQPSAPRIQPTQPALPVQPRSMATPTLPQRPASQPIEAAESPRTQQPAPAVTVASGAPATTEISTVRSGGASPLPGRPSASPQADPAPARPETPAAPAAAPAAQPAPAAKAEGSMGPLQVKSFATSVQTHRSDKGASFPPLGAAAGAASAASATTPAAAPRAPEGKSVTAVESTGQGDTSDGDIDQLLMAELSKEKVETSTAPAVDGEPAKPVEAPARPEAPAAKPAQDRPAMMSLEEEMDALLRDFTLDPPEKR